MLAEAEVLAEAELAEAELAEEEVVEVEVLAEEEVVEAEVAEAEVAEIAKSSAVTVRCSNPANDDDDKDDRPPRSVAAVTFPSIADDVTADCPSPPSSTSLA